MNVKELIQELTKYPETMDVFIEKNDNEYAFTLVNSSNIKRITFSDGKLKAPDVVVVLSDD